MTHIMSGVKVGQLGHSKCPRLTYQVREYLSYLRTVAAVQGKLKDSVYLLHAVEDVGDGCRTDRR